MTHVRFVDKKFGFKKIVALLIVMLVGVFSATDPCATGWKLKATLTNLKCTSATKSATACKTCCDDKAKCAGNTVTCASGKYLDSSKAGAAAGADDAARKTACCTDMATCANRFSFDAMCGTGMKKKASAAATKCTSNAASCSKSTCCEDDGMATCAAFAPAAATSGAQKMAMNLFLAAVGVTLWK